MHQLTGLDAQFLAAEDGRTHGHVSALGIYDPSTAPGARLTLEAVRDLVATRIDSLAPFRWRLAPVPLNLDHPYWFDDPVFDLEFHIRELALPAPGDDRQLAEQVARLHSRPLDRGRPLWELYLIQGLSGGRVAIMTKIHHAAVDGVSGGELLSVLLDPDPNPAHSSASNRRSALLGAATRFRVKWGYCCAVCSVWPGSRCARSPRHRARCHIWTKCPPCGCCPGCGRWRPAALC